MKSKKSLFNGTIIKNMLARYWVLFAAYFIIMGCIILVTLVNILQSTSGWIVNYATYFAHPKTFVAFLDNLATISVVIPYVAAAVVATILFSYLYNTRHTGMMASLPVTRESMFASVSAAGILGMTICNVTILLLALVLELAYGDVSLAGLGILFAILTLSAVTFFGMASFCCMLTGNIFAGPAVYGIFSFLTVGAEVLIHVLLSPIVFGMSTNYDLKTIFLSPPLFLGQNVQQVTEYVYDDSGRVIDAACHMEGMGLLVIYALVGLGLWLLAMRLYKRRHMETAGDTIAIEILKPIFRLCMTVGGGLVFAYMIQNTLYQVTPTRTMAAVYLCVLLCMGGFLGYFVAKMLIAKSIDVFHTGWKSVGLYILCTIALVTAIECDLFGYERHVPDAQEVESVYITIYNGENAVTLKEEENIRTVLTLHGNIITNKAFHEIEIGNPESYLPEDELDPAAAFHKQTVVISYTLKDGTVTDRKYRLSYDPDAIRNSKSEIRVLEAVLNTDEAIAARCIAPYAIGTENVVSAWIEWYNADTQENLHASDFSPGEIARLYNECILPDIADGRLGVYNIIENEAYAKGKYDCTISIEVGERQTNNRGIQNYFHMNFYVTTDASRTLQFLQEHGITPITIYDRAAAQGYIYTELGRYSTNKVVAGDDIYLDDMEIIGGKDGPVAVYVTED